MKARNLFIFIALFISGVLKSQCNWLPQGSDDYLQPGDDDYPGISIFKTDFNGVPYHISIRHFPNTYAYDTAYVKKFDGTNWIKVTKLHVGSNTTVNFTNNSVTFDRNGNIYFFYQPGDPAFTNAIISKFDGLIWSNVGVPDFGVKGEQNIAINENGIPYVFYKDPYAGVVVRKFDGNNWGIIGGPFATDVVNTDLKIDSIGKVYIKFERTYGTNLNNILVYNGQNWQTIVDQYTLPVSAYSTYTFSLDIDSFNYPYIALSDSGNKVSVFKYNGVNWQPLGSKFFSSPLQANTKPELHFNKARTIPFVGYYSSNGKEYIIMKCVNGNWDTVCIKKTAAPFINFQLDSLDNPNVNSFWQSSLSNVSKFDGSWHTVGEPQISEGNTGSVDFAVGKNGTSYVAYTLNQNLFSNVKRFNGLTWDTLGHLGTDAGGDIYYTQMELDSSETPYVAFSDFGVNGKTSVMKFNGTSWTYVGVRGITPSNTILFSFAVSKNGTPYLAYSDPTNNSIDVLYYNGTTWVSTGSVGVGMNCCSPLKIKIDKSGNVFILYSDFSQNGKATVKKYNGVSWQLIGGAGFSVGSIEDIAAFCLDKNGTPYATYWDHGYPAVNRAIVVKKFVGSSWVNLNGTVYLSPYVTPPAHSIDICFDKNNNLILAYCRNRSISAPQDGEVVVTQYINDAWLQPVNGYVSSGIARDLIVQADSIGKIYVAYFNTIPFVKELTISSQSPQITSQPSSLSLCSIDTAYIPIITTGAISYQWEVSRSGSGFYPITNGSYSYGRFDNAQTNILKMWQTQAGNSYRCIVRSCANSSLSDSIVPTINISPNLSVSLLSNNSMVCKGDSAWIKYYTTSSLAASWVNSGLTSNPVYVKPTTVTTYSAVTAPAANGCIGKAQITINADTFNLNVIANVSPSVICSGDQITLTGSGSNSSTYIWNNSIFNGIPFTIGQQGEYIVTSFNAVTGCPNRDTIIISPLICYVYPGDANYDGIANNNDLLEIGLKYGSNGTTRSSISNNWQAYLSADWGIDTVSTGYNLKHSDCNGNGSINADDTLAVNLNYGLTHALRLANISATTNTTGDIYFTSAQSSYGVGQQVAIDVYLGESANPLQNFYGAAFTLNYSDNTFIQPGSMSFSIDDVSWVGTINTDAIRLTKTMEASQTIDAAISKTNHTTTSGAGKIGTLRFIASNTVGNFSLTASNAYYIDNAAVQTPLTSATYSVYINTAVGLQVKTNNSNTTIYPNPNNGIFTLNNLNTKEEYHLEVKDVLGRTIYTNTIKSNSSTAQMKLNHAAGVYWLQISSTQGTETHKIIVE